MHPLTTSTCNSNSNQQQQQQQHPHRNRQTYTPISRWNVLYLFIAGTIDSILDFWCVYLFGYCQQKIIRSLRVDLFRAILGMEMGFFDQTPTGEITSRLTADTAEMANDLTWVFRFTIEAFVRIGGIIGCVALASSRLRQFALSVALLIFFVVVWLLLRTRRVCARASESDSHSTDVPP